MGLFGPSVDQLKEKRDIAGLITLLKTGRGKAKGEAAWALGELQSNDAVPSLIEALKYRDERCRAYAAWALGNIKDARATQPLLQALTDPKNEVRAYVSWALGNMEALSAIPDLERLSKDTDEDVKKYATEALEKIKSSAKYKEYLKKSEQEKKKKQQETVQTLLDEAEKLIKKLSVKKINTTSLEEIFLNAQEALEQKNYPRAEELAKKCAEQAKRQLSEYEHRILQEKTKAQEALEAAKQRKQELIAQQIPSSDELLTLAENYFNTEQYPETIEVLNQWNREIDAKIKQKKAEAEAEKHFKELDETLQKAEKLFLPLKEDPNITKALQNKQYLEYLEYAKKYKQEIEEYINKSSPHLTIQLPTENYTVDHWTKIETQLTNTGNTIAKQIQITISADIDYKITPLTEPLAPQQSTTLLLGIKPLAPGDLPVEITIKYIDGIDREYEQKELIWLKVQEQIPPTTIQTTTPQTETTTLQPTTETLDTQTPLTTETTLEPEIPTTSVETTPEPDIETPTEPHTEESPETHPQPETAREQPIVTEYINSVVDLLNDIGMKGMSNAATMISQMSGQEIEADQPELKTIPKEDIQSELEQLGEQIATVSMKLKSIGDTPMSGAIYMHFSLENSFKVADLLFNNPPGTTTEYNELTISSIQEAANIFGGQYLSAISEYIEIPIIPTTPEFQIATPAETAQAIQTKINEDTEYLLATELHFGAKENKIKGKLLIMFDNSTLELLLQKLLA
jgi:chemotaxis protein CheY-P-specific phosphatase CheC/HEAT repeat protein